MFFITLANCKEGKIKDLRKGDLLTIKLQDHPDGHRFFLFHSTGTDEIWGLVVGGRYDLISIPMGDVERIKVLANNARNAFEAIKQLRGDLNYWLRFSGRG